MNDLFGDAIDDVEKARFSDNEVELFFDNVIFEGELIKELGCNLEKLRGLNGSDKFNAIRKVAWGDFAWVYNLGESAPLSFDLACDLCGADAENIRAAISREFGNELRIMYKTVSARIPEDATLIGRRLGWYVSLSI